MQLDITTVIRITLMIVMMTIIITTIVLKVGDDDDGYDDVIFVEKYEYDWLFLIVPKIA